MTIKAGADIVSSYDGSASKTFTIAASTTAGAFTISDGTTTKTIQLAGKFTDTDTNTATAADNILDGSNSGTQITYAPYTSQQSKLSFDTSTTNPTRTDRLNLNGYLYATKLYSGGKEVFTSHQSIKSINTNNTAAQSVSANETIAGSGTINLHKVSKTGSYNDLSNIPVINQDLTASGFTPVANTYYKHTGTTTDLYTNGVIYLYNGTKYASLDGNDRGTTVQGEAISLDNADWEQSGGYNIVPKKPLVDGYEGVLCFNLEVIPHPLEINWDNATAWGDIQNAVGVRLFSFTYEGETQDVCFVEFPAGTEINNTVLTFSAYAIWLGTIIPLWADTEFWKAYGDGGLVGAISANDTGWVKYDVLPVYGNYMRFIVAVSITNIANQDIWGGYITGEQLWTKKPASDFSWSEIYPYYYSATKTLSSTPVAGSEVALLCDSAAEADIRLCASCGVTIGKVDGTNITFYAIDKPYKNLTLFVEYSKQE